jgi:hypothetical protein
MNTISQTFTYSYDPPTVSSASPSTSDTLPSPGAMVNIIGTNFGNYTGGKKKIFFFSSLRIQSHSFSFV